MLTPKIRLGRSDGPGLWIKLMKGTHMTACKKKPRRVNQKPTVPLPGFLFLVDSDVY